MRTRLLLGILAAILLNHPPCSAGVNRATIETKRRPDQLFILAVGINDTRGELRFARQDAEAFVTALEGGSKGIAASVDKQVLVDSQATRVAIRDALQKIVLKAKPNDMVVFFFAGRGVRHSDPAGTMRDYYLVPADVKDPAEPGAASEQINARLLATLMDQIQARKQWLILDTCDTQEVLPAFLATLGGSGASRRSLFLLGNSQEAYELPEVGHGVLTQALLQGLSGDAEMSNPRDGEISVAELQAYIYRKLPQLRAGRGPVQRPVSFTWGEDFPLARNPSTGDTTPPTITIQEPDVHRGVGSAGRSRQLIVKGKVADVSGIDSVRVGTGINDANLHFQPATVSTIQADGSYEFQTQVTLAVGRNVIVVEATDTRENTGKQAFLHNRDPEPDGPPALRQGADYALLIATDKYQHWPELSNPVRDANGVADVLSKIYSFKPEVISNPSKQDLRSVLTRYQKLKFADDDQLLIFIAGHGAFDEATGLGYLVSPQAPAEGDFAGTCLSFTELRGLIDRIDCKHILLVLDTCFSGAFDERVANNWLLLSKDRGNAKKSREEWIQEAMKLTPVRLVLASARKESVRDGQAGQGSPFARALLDTLQDRGGEDGILTTHEILQRAVDLKPTPLLGEFPTNRVGSHFLFIAPEVKK